MYSVKKSWKLSFTRASAIAPPNPSTDHRAILRKKLRSRLKNPFFFRGVGGAGGAGDGGSGTVAAVGDGVGAFGGGGEDTALDEVVADDVVADGLVVDGVLVDGVVALTGRVPVVFKGVFAALSGGTGGDLDTGPAGWGGLAGGGAAAYHLWRRNDV